MRKLITKFATLAFLSCMATTTQAQQKVTLNFSHQMAPEHTLHLTAVRFSELVSQKTNGNLTVKVYPSASLGAEKDNTAGLKNGMLDMAIIAVEQYPSFVPETAALVLPYLYKDYPHVMRILQSDVAKDLQQMVVDKTGIRILTFMPMAFRQMFTVDKEIKTAADLKGLKMRVPESPIYVAAFKQFGAVPTPLAWGEVYASLQTGVAKGVENTPEAVISASLQEVTKYMSLSNHIEGPATISMSDQAFKKLSSEYQAALLSAAAEAAIYEYELTVSRDLEAREKLKAKLTIIQPDAASFKSAINYDEIQLVSSDKGKELVKRLLAIQ
jgi:hypothetical protein